MVPGLFCNVHGSDIVNIPHVNERAKEAFHNDYIHAAPHRAFAIAPGGAWSWVEGKLDAQAASAAAMSACRQYTNQQCMVFAVNNEIKFDSKKWPGLWGPYKNKQQAQQAQIGTALGERFPDIKFTDPAGKKKSIAQLKGKVVFVHFWGCWCPSCRYEFVTLIDLYRILNDLPGHDVEFVVMQMREPITQARAWAKENNLTALPLSDSGVQSSNDTELTLSNGKKIQDRAFANLFPASYVIDKHGVVVFSHMGSVSDWTEYVAFFRDVNARSGK